MKNEDSSSLDVAEEFLVELLEAHEMEDEAAVAQVEFF